MALDCPLRTRINHLLVTSARCGQFRQCLGRGFKSCLCLSTSCRSDPELDAVPLTSPGRMIPHSQVRKLRELTFLQLGSQWLAVPSLCCLPHLSPSLHLHTLYLNLAGGGQRDLMVPWVTRGIFLSANCRKWNIYANLNIKVLSK